MIIDLILDRKDNLQDGIKSYNAHDFYTDCMSYNGIFNGIADGITRAMDGGTEADVKNFNPRPREEGDLDLLSHC